MNDKTPGQVITFYSYKGDTGRTVALANVAALLSKENKVLAIDWDLEAPGLYNFFSKDFSKTKLETPGLIDFFEDIQKNLSIHPEWKSDQCESDLFGSLHLDKYLYEIVESKLFLLVAGRLDEYYPSQITRFNWEALFYRAPWLFRLIAKYLSYQFDYILIDSRTGLTDIGGICTALMPDKLVAMFTPHYQSVNGIINIIDTALQYRKESEDLRPLNIFPLPYGVELQEKELFDRWRYGSYDDGVEGFQPAFEQMLKKSYSLERCDLGYYFDIIHIQKFISFSDDEEKSQLNLQTTGRLSLRASYSILAEILAKCIAPWTAQDVQMETVYTASYQNLQIKADNWFNAPEFGDKKLSQRQPRVFLCYCHKDFELVKSLWSRLTKDGVDVWFDKEQLLPGQNWELEIENAVDKSDAVLICLSKHFNEEGFRQNEMRLAHDTALRKPVGEIFIIPSKLEECDIPPNLKKYHCENLFERGGYKKLLQAIKKSGK